MVDFELLFISPSHFGVLACKLEGISVKRNTVKFAVLPSPEEGPKDHKIGMDPKRRRKQRSWKRTRLTQYK